MTSRLGTGKRRLSPIVVIAAVALATWLLLRVALWVQVGPGNAGWSHAPAIFARGLWFDAATLAFLLAPWLLVTALLPHRRSGAGIGAVRWVSLWITIFLLLFEAIAEFVFWDEFTTRFNFIAVDYLLYTHEVIGNILSSYPVGLITAGIALAAALLSWAIHRAVALGTGPLGRSRRMALLGAAVALPLAAYVAADVDQMTRTGNTYADELSGNGIFTFAAAMRRNELDFERNYATMPQTEADAILAQVGVRRPPLSRVRTARPGESKEAGTASTGPAFKPASFATTAEAMPALASRPRNVILVSVESLSAEFLGAYGNRQGITPNLDRLAREGLKFEHVFATGTRTVRGLEALSLGTPPVPGQAIVRRPHNEHLSTIGELLEHEGYLTYFIYGGYGYFDNMNEYFRANDYHVIDRTDFPNASIPFENIWGVADEALFANAVQALDAAYASGNPFFATIMTTSNHRPFTYPPGRIDIPPPGGREGGVKYTDYAIGQFIESARHKPWFDDTLFVFVADHCAAVAGKITLPVAKYRIPLILYAPKLVRPGVYAGLASQVDIPPTLMDILGVPGSDRFFGQSLLRGSPERAFISNYQDLGYYKAGLLTVLAPKRKVEAYRVDPATLDTAPAAVDPALRDEAIAYYQSGSRAFRTGALRSPAY